MDIDNRVAICALRRPTEGDSHFARRLAELQGLCNAAGTKDVAVFVQNMEEPHRSLYLGSGKVAEIADFVKEEEIPLAVFDGELSPAQVRNLESRLAIRVVDRTQLILDIFAMRARTSEGRLQVEIAQLHYLLPRLTGFGAEMSRLGGGVGTRGPGETQLETDRRHIRNRINHLEEKLAVIRRQRQTQRQKRQGSTPVIALVGYTNAGKTTLLERWTRDRGGRTTDAGQARLFDTLDPVARRVKAGSTASLVVMDTVGFIENLPHLLVDAFRATLEEVNMADAIVLVVDSVDHPMVKLDTTYQVLNEIDALDKPVITFFNKVDSAETYPPPDARAQVNIYGSATNGQNLERLYGEVDTLLGLNPVTIEVAGNPQSPEFWDVLMTSGRVLEAEVLPDRGMRVKLEVERRRQHEVMSQFAEGNFGFSGKGLD